MGQETRFAGKLSRVASAANEGQRFLTGVVTEKAPAPPINVVLNWTAEVKK